MIPDEHVLDGAENLLLTVIRRGPSYDEVRPLHASLQLAAGGELRHIRHM